MDSVCGSDGVMTTPVTPGLSASVVEGATGSSTTGGGTVD